VNAANPATPARSASATGPTNPATPVIQRLLDHSRPDAAPGPTTREDIYPHLCFPRGVQTPDNQQRPYLAINMVATLDGKVVIGGPGTTRLIGTSTDHYLMAQIESQADAVIFGAGLIREDNPAHPNYTAEMQQRRKEAGLRPQQLWGVVSTRGEFDKKPRLFEVGREHTALFTSAQIGDERSKVLEQWTQVFVCGDSIVDPAEMGRICREQLGVHCAISLGGPTLNASLAEASAVDEFFLTLAPKLQGGSRLPTAVEGIGFPPETLPRLTLISAYLNGSELYLRYRLPAATETTPTIGV
jgi:5-amino-6-(5-phosphoribosylamino)uracil reductase